jgi:phthalate 4,5-dioxygenase oxygenase subunit
MNREDNEALTRVGPGSLMGDLLRQYWIPALLSADLPAADAPAVRVQLLGEALVAFRDSAGAVGLLAENCPHRGASLYFGRCEAGGLRCVYHGWKFDRAGRCLDMPNEPPELRFAEKVRATAYPVEERNGVVWAYLGPRAMPPPLPALEWNLATDSPPFLWRMVRGCNWMQALEGDLDSSHIGILHARTDDADAPTVLGAQMPGAWAEGMRLARGAGPPHIEAIDTPYGALYSARRALDEERAYHRVHPFLLPFHTMVGGGVDGGPISFNGKVWVPMDDRRTLVLEWQYRPGRPWSDSEREELARVRNPFGFLPATSAAGGAFHPAAHLGNDFRRDHALERGKLFFGVQANPLQDAAVQESMGAIVDRSKEHLGPADAMIIRVRRRLLAAARALRERGEIPGGVDDPSIYQVRPVGAVLPAGADWEDATRARREAFTG